MIRNWEIRSNNDQPIQPALGSGTSWSPVEWELQQTQGFNHQPHAAHNLQQSSQLEPDPDPSVQERPHSFTHQLQPHQMVQNSVHRQVSLRQQQEQQQQQQQQPQRRRVMQAALGMTAHDTSNGHFGHGPSRSANEMMSQFQSQPLDYQQQQLGWQEQHQSHHQQRLLRHQSHHIPHNTFQQDPLIGLQHSRSGISLGGYGDVQPRTEHRQQPSAPDDRSLSYASAAAMRHRPQELQTYLSGGHMLQGLASEADRSWPHGAYAMSENTQARKSFGGKR